MCEEYVQSLESKMKHGGRGFLMIADFDKYGRCLANAEHLSIGRFLAEQTRKVWIPVKLVYALTWRFFRSRMDMEPITESKERMEFYHWGTKRACEVLTSAGFEIVDADTQVCPRDPVIHFRKP
jgi:hypothetical protein